ncbi:MAG: hypothetical protein Q7U52_10470 [Hydrogenophaga sp.]|uniref:DUF5681 domain-containing protein n=1 Tax=Hydrogenophaga sp. TaxID=1904254 RepID=UPI00271EC4CC|nr:DUF5681 domain-containing protein [Hydrogenophaga sp.]MDO9148071.1 hypothetical protein [Hydrogenophaga sp.]MDO9603696.1 hypothetical protein [Hydrogenophaga sp.]
MTAKKTPTTAWKPGRSGNPAGRPPGKGFAGQTREALGDRLPEILEAVIQAALAGDMGAARILLDRTLPALKPLESPLQPLPLPTGATLAQQAGAVIEAASRGDIAPGQAAQLVGAVASLARIIETDELQKRIEALEAAHAKP